MLSACPCVLFKTPGFGGSQDTPPPPIPDTSFLLIPGVCRSGLKEPQWVPHPHTLLVRSPWDSSREASPLKYSHLISEQTSVMTAVTPRKLRSQATTHTLNISDIVFLGMVFPSPLMCLFSYCLLTTYYSVHQTLLGTYCLQDIMPCSWE